MRYTIYTFVIFIIATLAVFRAEVAADLETDLREFVALVPRRRIGYIAARHLILDQRFRRALNYIRSADFTENWQKMRETEEFAAVEIYLTNSTNGNAVKTIIEKIPNQLRKYRIPSKVLVDMMLQRDLGSFIREVVQSLPRAKISSLMTRKVKEGGDFAKLYEAMRRNKFRQLLDDARKSTNLAQPIGELDKHSVDVDEVIKVGFSVLNWGP